MNGSVTYHQQVSYCGKPRCRRCRDGIGHGPYWYAYRTENGRTIRTYIGKHLPSGVQLQDPVPDALDPAGPGPAESETVLLRVRTLGQFQVDRRERGEHGEHGGQDWQALTEGAWQQQRVRALLACLLSSPGRKLGREQVIDALWPDAEIETGSSRLDRSVYSLRQLLEPELSRLAGSQLLRLEREVLILADASLIWVDADAFEQLLAQAHAANDAGARERLLEEAAALYGGDFLAEERYADWAMPRREALLRSERSLLLELAEMRIGRGAFIHAIEPLDRLLASDPLNEAAVQRLIIVLANLERRGEALRAYHRFADRLQREYHLAPLAETRMLYDAVQQGDSSVSMSLASRDAWAAGPYEGRQAYKVQIGRSHSSPLIGRDAELAAMRDMLDTAEEHARARSTGRRRAGSLPLDTSRHPQCALLVGEAGIGKTRLAEELSREAQKRGWAVAWSRVYAQESGVPYRQWTEVLRSAMASGLWQKQEISKRPLLYAPLTSLLPELHEALPSAELPSTSSPDQEQLRLWEAALELLSKISERSPLLVVLDDFHWADASSSELFAYLVRRLHDRPIVIIGTYRDNELTPSNPLRPLLTDLHREQVIASLPLSPLSNEQIASLVSPLPLPGTVVQYIQGKAAGNPFFAEELARSAGSQLTGPDGSQVVESSTTAATIPLPDTITAVLELRMSRLSSACSRLLSSASVLGGSFTFPLLCSMEGSSADEDSVLDLVEEALAAGVLTEEGTGTRISYHFWHPLLVSHLYDQLSAARRARLHRRAAEVLQRSYAGREEEGAAAITSHLVEGGGEPAQIVHYAGLAADRAYSLSAYPEAEGYYRTAASHLEEVLRSQPPVDSVDESAHLAYLLERQGECTRILGKYEEARQVYERVLDIRAMQRKLASRADYQREAQIDALLWREIAMTWYDTGDTARAQQYCEGGEQVLREAGVVGGPAWASIRFLEGYINWRNGNYDEARKMAQEALILFEEALKEKDSLEKPASHSTGTRRTLAGNPVDLGRTYTLLGAIANSNSQPTEALDHFNTALPLFEQHDCQREIANASCNIGDSHLRRAEHELAQASLRRSLHLAERIGDAPLISVVFYNLGELAIRIGNLPEAENWFRQSISVAEQINDQIYVSLWNVGLANTFQIQGRLSEAKACVCRTLTIGRAMSNTPCISMALVSLGKLRTAQAMEIFEQQAIEHKVSRTHQSEKQSNNKIQKRFLMRAKASLERALALQDMEVETKYEGQLALAHALFLLGELDTAHYYAIRTLEEARQYEFVWGYVRCQRLLGSILAAQGQQEQAEQYFEEAMQVFRQGGMRLEYARTLQDYGATLLQHRYIEKRKYSQGLDYLREARSIFAECHAELDRQSAERLLAAYEGS